MVKTYSTATGTASRNVTGVAIAISVFSTVRWWGRAWLSVLFAVARLIPGLLRPLRRLSFIHFARWTLVQEIPFNGSPQREEHLRYPHLFFESNFNGGWEEYIDAFSYLLTKGMWMFWRSSFGFPGSLPTGPFKTYIRANEITASHFYSAYPLATASMVLEALEIEAKVAAFVVRARGLSSEDFESAWRGFLVDVQDCL